MHYLTEKDVEDNLDMKELIGLLKDVFIEYGEGSASSSSRNRTGTGSIMLGTMPAVSRKLGLAGLKTMMASESGKRSVVVYLFDSKTSDLIAVIDGKKLSQIRTGAIPAMVTKMLVDRKDPAFALIGSGHQAVTQLSGMLAAFDLSDVRVYSSTYDNAVKFAEREGRKNGLDIKAYRDVKKAISGADVITTVTKATEPIFSRKDLGEEYHVNLTGSNILSRREVAEDVLAESDLPVVEHLEQAMKESTEIIELSRNHPEVKIYELKDIMNRPDIYSGKSRTVFKTMGIGLEDIAAGYLVLRNMGIL